jgi:capsular exopolysaccharide synthesis family protein
MPPPLEPRPLPALSSAERGARSGELSESSTLRALPAPEALSAPPGVETLWHALRRRWGLILVLGLLAGSLGAAGAWFVVPGNYTVQVLLQLSSRQAQASLESDTDPGGYQRSQAALFLSYPVLHTALDKPEIAQLPEVQAHSDPYEWLLKDIKTDLLLGPEILHVTLSGDHGEDVALLLNELTRAYLKESVAKEQSKVLERIKQLEANYKQLSETLREKRLRLANLEESVGVEPADAVSSKIQAALSALNSLQTLKVTLALTRKELEVERNGLRDKVQEPDRIVITDFAVAEEMKNDPIIARHHLRLGELEDKIREWERLSPSGAPPSAVTNYQKDSRAIRERIRDHIAAMRPSIEARLRSKIVEESKEGLVKVERQLLSLGEKEKSLDAEIKKQERLVQTLRANNRPADKEAAGIESLRDEVLQLDLVQKKVGDELATWQASLPLSPRVTVLESAKAPLSRKRDRQIKYAAGSFVILLGLVFMGVALWEFRARRVYHSGDVAVGLGLDLLGTLPPVPAGARAVVPVGGAGEHGPLLEAVDGVRTRLLHTARNYSVRVLMVASAIGGEGKTSLATHLAASLARGGRKTLLVDCDLRNPGAHVPFQARLAPGFCEGLRGEAAYEDLVQSTALENLWLLSAGQCDRRALQALGKEDLGKVFDRFKAEFDFVVVDVCPVLPVPDALWIGQYADAALFAVLRNVSRLPAVYAAQQRLGALDIPTLGAVVVGEAAETYGIDRYAAPAAAEDTVTR